MTSEATYDLRFELSDLNYLGCHVFLASKGFCELIDRKERRGGCLLGCLFPPLHELLPFFGKIKNRDRVE